MCISPIKTYTNSHACDYRSLHPVQISVPCGRCYQCRQSNSIQWMVRSYFEAKSTFAHGGYVLFDTLTYNDDNVAKLSDIYPPAFFTAHADKLVFRKTDLAPFFHRLRRKLELAGYNVKDKLRYLYCSEYGDGEEYVAENGKVRVGTCRPHYHILFFVTADIPPLKLSHCIADSWLYGKTDGVRLSCSENCAVHNYCHKGCLYQSMDYVLRNRVFRQFSTESLNKILYVQKYISKSSPYDRRMESICYQLMSIIHGSGWTESRTYRKEYQRLRSQVTVFHEQSQNFGFGSQKDYEIWLSDNSDNYRNYKVNLIISNKLRFFDLPKFMRQKLYMHKIKCYGGYSFKYKDSSKDFVKYLYKKQISRCVDEINTMLMDVDVYKKSELKCLLGSRSSLDVAKYLVCYRGRLGYVGDDSEADYLRSKFSDDGYFSDHHHTLFIYRNQYSLKYYGFPKVEHFFRKNTHMRKGVKLELKDRSIIRKIEHCDQFSLNLRPICQLPIINENTSADFKDFDKIVEIFEFWKYAKGLETELELLRKNKNRVNFKKQLLLFN